MKTTKWDLLLSLVLAAFVLPLLSATSASAAVIPTTYMVQLKELRQNAPAGTMVTFELHEDATCSSLIASDTLDIDDVPIKQKVKTQKPRQGSKALSLVELHHVFSVTPTAGADLFVRVTGSGMVAPAVLGDCQPQEPAPGGSPGPGLTCTKRTTTTVVGLVASASCLPGEIVVGGGVNCSFSPVNLSVSHTAPAALNITEGWAGGMTGLSCGGAVVVWAICCVP